MGIRQESKFSGERIWTEGTADVVCEFGGNMEGDTAFLEVSQFLWKFLERFSFELLEMDLGKIFFIWKDYGTNCYWYFKCLGVKLQWGYINRKLKFYIRTILK